MTDRRNKRDRERRERKKSEEAGERRREDRDKRSDDLKESWRRNHPSDEDGSSAGKGPRPGRRGKGRQA
jgi:hypothetical protein